MEISACLNCSGVALFRNWLRFCCVCSTQRTGRAGGSLDCQGSFGVCHGDTSYLSCGALVVADSVKVLGFLLARRPIFVQGPRTPVEDRFRDRAVRRFLRR